MDIHQIEIQIQKSTDYIDANPWPHIPSVASEPSLVAQHIDHTLLKPDTTPAQIEHLCKEAIQHKFKSCCVNSSNVTLVASLLAGSSSIPCCVVGFPLGATTTATKAYETVDAIKAGAREIDMVINIGLLKSGNFEQVYTDIREVVSVATPAIPVKVIIETSLLTREQKISASVIAALAGAAYVKTSTGFNGGGATVDDVALMHQAVAFRNGSTKVKASGGVKSFEAAISMLRAGADRIGTSSGVAILTGAATSAESY